MQDPLEDAVPKNATSPVFIHSEWRTASTYLWAKLGRAPGNLGFCEPFNEVLSHLGADSIQTLRSDGWTSGHPALADPYFAEYAGLVAESGGIARYRSRFSYPDYYDLDPVVVEPQRDYLQGLLDFAADQGLRPVLGFCRSVGRMPWLTRAFPGAVHLELRREPVSQWLSAYFQNVRHANSYFLVGYVAIAGLATGSPYMDGVRKELEIPWTPSREPSETFPFYAAWVERQAPETLFRVFWHVHTLNNARALGLADLVVDANLMTTSLAYREQLSKTLGGYGFEASFDDAAMPSHDAGDLMPLLDRARLEADAYTAHWLGNGAVL